MAFQVVEEKMELFITIKIVDKLNECLVNYPQDVFDYTFISFDAAQSTYGYILDHAKEKLGDSVVEGIIPINVCAHCGPGTVGMVVSQKINGKALSEFI